MPPAFVLDADFAHNLLRLRITGTMASADVDALFDERARLTAAFDCPPGHHRTIVDVQEAPMQPDEMLARVALLAQGLSLDNRRAAIVVTPQAGATRLQARNLAARYNLCLFDRVEDAERWIRL